MQFAEFGGPEVLREVQVDEPHAAAGQVRVDVRAVGVNPVDWKLRSGAMTIPLPSITGGDIAGIVDEIGDGVSGVAVGDEVFGVAVGGGAAEYALSEHYAHKPPNLSWAEAAGLPVPVETAQRVLDLLGVASDQTLLINGATGGVGTTAVQFAVARGARVIGTASAPNHESLRSAGAIPTSYGDGLVERVRAITESGVDAAFDVAGHGALPALIALTGNADHVVTIADATAADHGVRFSSGGGERSWDALGRVAELAGRGEFSLPVARTFALADAAAAHAESEAGHVRGKLVLVVD